MNNTPKYNFDGRVIRTVDKEYVCELLAWEPALFDQFLEDANAPKRAKIQMDFTSIEQRVPNLNAAYMGARLGNTVHIIGPEAEFPTQAVMEDLSVHGKAYFKVGPSSVPTDLADMQERERRMTEEAAAYASNLKGKHATTGATYSTLVRRIKALETNLDSLTTALGKKGVGTFYNGPGNWDITLPTDSLNLDLLQRIAEVYRWRKTGMLEGKALHKFASYCFPDGEGYGDLRLAEETTILQFLEKMLTLLMPSSVSQTCAPVQRSGDSVGCTWTPFSIKE